LIMFKESLQYVIELDNLVYRLSDSTLYSVKDLNEIDGNKWVVSDFYDTVSRTANVQAPAKYADVMVRKKLLDTGEVDGTAVVFTHWRKQKEANSTDVFFTAMPSRLVEHNFERIKKDADCVLMFPLYTVLYAALKEINPEEPVAIIFQHNRFVDLVIGTRGKIYHANRSTIPEQQSTSMWNMVFAEIASAESENSIAVNKYYLLSWIDSTPLPEFPEDIQQKFSVLEEEPIMHDDEIYHISFTRVLRSLKPSGPCCISPPIEKISYYSQKCLPFLTLFLLICTLFLAGGYFFYGQRAKHLKIKTESLKNDISQVLSGLKDTQTEVDFQAEMDFVSEISLAKRAASYKKVMKDISEALSEGMSLDLMNLGYKNSRVKASLSGKIKLPFDLARKEYQDCIKKLKEMKYEIKDNDFKVKLNNYKFIIDFEKQI